MNTVIWLAALLAQGGVTPEPPDPPASESGRGSVGRKRFVVKGKLGYIVISDRRLIAFFQRILDGEKPTEIEVTQELLEIAPSYKVPLTDNITVIESILEKLETLQAQRLQEAEEVKRIHEDLEKSEWFKSLETRMWNDGTILAKAEEEAEEALQRKTVDDALESWLDALVTKAKDKLNTKAAEDLSVSTRVQRLKKRLARWRQ